MIETQKTISDWAQATFGPLGSNMAVAARANQEMAELIKELTLNDNSPKAIEEIADIVIVLYRLVERHNRNLGDAIDAKMAINRARKWRLDGAGQGYHV